MPGKHARNRAVRSPVGLFATGVVTVAAVAAGTFGAVQLGADRTGSTTPLPAAVDAYPFTPTPTPDLVSPSVVATTTAPSAKPSKSAERASRSGTRTSPSPTKSTSGPGRTQPPSTVVSTGFCGASFYDEGQLTANGETFDPDALTAAHKTLAFNTRVRVTNPDNGKSVVVRINDRGPYIDGRCLDLSRAAFAAIASLSLGEIDVRYQVLAADS